ncbi:hypothetical protein ACWDR3_08110 [Streptomyces sp. NPDC001002]
MSPRKPRQGGALHLTGAKGVYAVHAGGGVPDQLAGAARTLDSVTGTGAFPGTATVLVGAGFNDVDALCDVLEPALEECRSAGTTLLRMVMSGGAIDVPERPSPARRIADNWGLDVLAPAGVAMVVPGGTLFAPDLPDAVGGWWQFSPARQPRGLGPRHPVPGWQNALDRVPADSAPGCVIEHIPAGLLIQPAGAPPEGVDAIRYALPVDPEGPVLLVNTGGSAPVPPDALADVLAALPGSVRGTVRLASCDGSDLLALGQEVADLLGTEVQVANGLTVLLDEPHATAPAPRPAGRSRGADESPWGGPGHGGTARTVLLDSDGNPSWQPYVRTVTCSPAETGAAPRISNWRAPIGGLRPAPETGTLLLDGGWQVTVTRAGLWIGAQRASLPASSAARPARADLMAIDIGVPGGRLDTSLLAPLEHLLASLQDDVRTHTLIQLLGEPDPETLRALRRLAIRHDLALTSRETSVSMAVLPGGRGLPTVAPGTATTGASAASSAGTGGSVAQAPATARVSEPVAPVPSTITAGAEPDPLQGQAVEPPEPTVPVHEPPVPAVPLGAIGADPVAIRPDTRPTLSGGPATASSGMPETREATASASASASTTASATGAGASALRVGGAEREPVARPASPPETPVAERAPWPPPPPALDPDAERAEGGSEVGSEVGSDVDEEELALPAVPLAGLVSSLSLGAEAPASGSGESRSGGAEETGGEVGGDSALRTVTWLPVRPSYRSSEAERDAVRVYLGERWDHHAGAVTRALTRMPALRDSERPEEVAADLASLHAYLAESADTRLALLESLEAGGTELVPFLGCVASGLRTLPSYRGAAVRSAGGVLGEAAELLLPGEELGEAVPVGAVAFDKAYPSVSADHYLIWSMTGRKAAAVLTEPEAGPGAASDNSGTAEAGSAPGSGVLAGEVLFAPGTRLRVLQVVQRTGATVVLLRELPESAPPSAPGLLDDADNSVLKRLLGLIDLSTAVGSGARWPQQCTGVLGMPAPDA